MSNWLKTFDEHQEHLFNILEVLMILDLNDEDDLHEYVCLNICGNYYNRVYNL